MSSPGRRAASSREADIHLRKAREFRDAALAASRDQQYSPAVSDAVICGINASDVIGIAEAGLRHDSPDHEAKIALLRNSGPLGAKAAPILDRLLPLKNLAQYRSTLANEAEAQRAIADAEELLGLATRARAQLP